MFLCFDHIMLKIFKTEKTQQNLLNRESYWKLITYSKDGRIVLASVAQLVGALSRNRKVAGSIPVQMCHSAHGREPTDDSLSRVIISLPPFLPLQKAMKKMSSVRIIKIKEGIIILLFQKMQIINAKDLIVLGILF